MRRFHAVSTHCEPCVCVCVCVCMDASPLHFLTNVQVGNKRFREFETNGLRTDGRIDGPSYRDVRTHLKSKFCSELLFSFLFFFLFRYLRKFGANSIRLPQSAWLPHGFHLASVRLPFGFRSSFAQLSLDFRSGFTQLPLSFCSLGFFLEIYCFCFK